MTAAQFEDAERRELVEKIHERKRADHVTIPTSTRPIHLPTDKERA